MDERHPYAYFCFTVALIASSLSMLPTFAAWKRGALGRGDRWPDPIVAALCGNAAMLTFGLIQKSKEAAFLNATCGFLQLVNLGTYVALSTRAMRIHTLRRVCRAALYIVFLVWVGLQHDSVYVFNVFCMLPSLAAAFAPVVTTVYVGLPKRKTTELLPNCFVLVQSISNGIAWVVRGLLIDWNVIMAVQNGFGAFCSLWLLVLLFVWDKPEKTGPKLEDAMGGAGGKATRAKSVEYPRRQNDNGNLRKRRTV